VQAVPFPRWVPPEVKRQARRLSEASASAAVGSWCQPPHPVKRGR
jgi:hypothetical protein